MPKSSLFAEADNTIARFDIMRRPNSIIVLIIHFLHNLQKKTLSKSLLKFKNSTTRARGLETWQPLNSISVADIG